MKTEKRKRGLGVICYSAPLAPRTLQWISTVSSAYASKHSLVNLFVYSYVLLRTYVLVRVRIYLISHKLVLRWKLSRTNLLNRGILIFWNYKLLFFSFFLIRKIIWFPTSLSLHANLIYLLFSNAAILHKKYTTAFEVKYWCRPLSKCSLLLIFACEKQVTIKIMVLL